MDCVGTGDDERFRWRGLEQTAYYFWRMELKNRNVYYPPDYRKYVEQRVEELRLKYEPDSAPMT